MKEYMPVVAGILRDNQARTILDAPSGGGWLHSFAPEGSAIDGIDLYASEASSLYRRFTRHDLDDGIPDDLGPYDAIASCEGIEHLASPGLFFKTALARLRPGGTLIVTTPNAWHPSARIKFLTTGFLPGFPPLAGKIRRGDHMHLIPWSWPQLHLHMKLAGFTDIQLHPCGSRRNAFDALAAPLLRRRIRKMRVKAQSEEEVAFWTVCASDASLTSRRLVVSGRSPI